MSNGSKRYDVFISHASEDKQTVVRELAHALRSRRFAVWYDEFSLQVGDGLRKSIDEGLAQSRFGIVVLSRAFFQKQWTQWELDGLVQRQMTGHTVILPVWHEVSREDVATNSPSLANIVAATTAEGIDAVVNKLAGVLRPEKSSLEVAYEILRKFGADPPPISDDWWLYVAEEYATPYSLVDPWRLRVPVCPSDTPERGWNLAWSAMQWEWCQEACYRRLTCTAHPNDVLDFIGEMPGLEQAACSDVESVLSHAPQLSIPGLAGRFENEIQQFYEKSVQESSRRRQRNDRSGSACTLSGLCPLCETNVALRHPTFGDWEPAYVANWFCKPCNGRSFGIEIADVLFWLLSNRSEWIGNKNREFLLRGIAEWGIWNWGTYAAGAWFSSDEVRSASHYGQLSEYLLKQLESKSSRIRIPSGAVKDLHERIGYSVRTLQFLEPVEDIAQKFLRMDFLKKWLKENRSRGYGQQTRKKD
ncbi:MAG: toll/interleukin-1 receptor domain-containing protein [Planctomycetia bacterium]|nr:toll/interleukin-1 receptor domain-containing protein [Planctomycetia bacterium]